MRRHSAGPSHWNCHQTTQRDDCQSVGREVVSPQVAAVDGGARPKAAVSLADGRLAIAKFPKPDDIRAIAAGEIFALTLAAQAGIQVADHRLVPVGGLSVAVITRFDRVGSNRIPFISAATLLGLPQGDQGAYTVLADGIRQFGNDVPGDLRELWRRLVFSFLASNHDDHLRNHGFLMRNPGRWSLSPAYDINPVPEIDRVRMSKTAINEDWEEPTITSALAAARGLGSRRSRQRKFTARCSRLFPVGAKPRGGFTSAHPPWTPTPAPLDTR